MNLGKLDLTLPLGELLDVSGNPDLRRGGW